jgi:hypothetical protein
VPCVTSGFDRKDKFNPRIQQRTSTTLQETQNIDLRSMTGGIETMLDIVRKLNGKSYDKLQLIRVALELLEQKQSTKDQAQTAKPETLPQGQTGKGIEAGALSAVQRTALRRKFLGRTVLTAVAISAVTSGFMGGVNMLNNSIKTTQTAVQKAPGDSGDPQLWRVDAHGLAPTNPYWTQDAFYGYTNTTKWRDSGGSLDIIMMPTTLPDPNKPHITVSTMAANDLVAIPIEEGTQVSAVRALSVNDKPLELLVGEMSDGRMVSKAHNDNTYYRLEYDLTKSDRPVLTPHWPIQPDAKVSVLRDPSAYPGTKGDAAEYIRDTFTYDANPAIDKTVAKTDPELYLDKMYDLQRCKCDQCNTVAAIIESQKHPETNMAFVTGYLHGDSKKDGHSYLGAGPMHAWFNNDGKIDDATAVRTDSKSVLPTEMPTDQVDKRWTESQKALGLEAKPNNDTERNAVLYSLAALALAGAATLEARKKYMQRAVGNALQWERWYTAGADIDPRDAVRLLQWQAYARPTSPLPQLNGADGYHGESPDTIPSTTLAEVARGGFTAGPQLTRAQQRGLQNTAQALLHGRRHASQHVYAPKHRNIGAVRP